MGENEKIGKEDNLTDIVFNEQDKSEKTKRFMFIAIIVAVLAVIIIVIATSFSSKDEVSHTAENLDFLEDRDPFFMDSPADAMEPSNDVVRKDEFQENDKFTKDYLFDDEKSGETASKDETPSTNVQPKSSLQPTSSLSPAGNRESSIFPASNSQASEQGESLFQDSQEVSSPEPLVQQTAPVDRTPPTNNSSLTSERKYYIQTGTFFKLHPNEKFLKSIEKLGFTPLVDMYLKDGQEIRRVLVGPFESRGDASESLQTIRESLVKDAYILRTRLH